MPQDATLAASPATSAAPAHATLDLAELVATRLCHDLAGLCGTLQGALELLGEDPENAPDAAALSQETARALSDRLRMIRAAWGTTAQPLGLPAIVELAAGLPGAPRVALDTSGFALAEALRPAPARVLLNALLLAAESLPHGGTIELTGDSGGFVLGLRGRRAGWPARLPHLLGAPGDAVGTLLADGPRALQATLLVRLAAAAGAGLLLRPADEDWPADLCIAWPR